MTDYNHTTVALQRETKDDLDDLKPDGMTWDLFIRRMAEAWRDQD